LSEGLSVNSLVEAEVVINSVDDFSIKGRFLHGFNWTEVGNEIDATDISIPREGIKIFASNSELSYSHKKRTFDISADSSIGSFKASVYCYKNKWGFAVTIQSKHISEMGETGIKLIDSSREFIEALGIERFSFVLLYFIH